MESLDPMDTKILDNFFKNPDDIRNTALQSEYISSPGYGWLGYRSYSITENFSTMFTNMLHCHIPETKSIKKFFCCFHYSLDETKFTAPRNFHDYKIHSDFCDYAGVVYLTPDPPLDTGTSFYDQNYNLISSVQNKFNRLIYYSARINHAPTDLFGTIKENGRLVLTFFSDMPPDPNIRFLAS